MSKKVKEPEPIGPPEWTTIKFRLGDLQEWDKNPATIEEAEAEDLAESLDSLGYIIPFVAAAPPNGKKKIPLVDGHQRKAVDLKLRNTSPDTLVDVRIPDRPLTEEQRAEAVVRLRKNVGHFVKEKLFDLAPHESLIDWGFTEEELDLDFSSSFEFTGEQGSGGSGEEGRVNTPEEARKTLSDRFIVPPFSILDARQGYWQSRKAAWIALGIQSELGRGFTSSTSARAEEPSYRQIKNRGSKMEIEPSQTMLREKPSADQASKNQEEEIARLQKIEDTYKHNREVMLHPRTADLQFYKEKRKLEAELGRELSVKEFYGFYEGGEGSADQGTSIFDPVLAELAYRWWIPQSGGEKILDPFAGGSVRGIVASLLDKQYTGIDLSGRQLKANRAQAKEICKGLKPKWIEGDSRKVKKLAPGEYDFLFSCPPYGDLEVYSDDPKDLSTLDYSEFIKSYGLIIKESVSMLKPNRFACFVVGDFRDKKGFYRNFPGDTIRAFQEAGAILYVEAILVTAVGSLPIRIGRQFDGYRKLGKTHQNVLVFYKGNPKAIPDQFGKIEIEDPSEVFGDVS